MIKSAIVTKLRAEAGVIAIVAQRIFIGEAPQGQALPYIIVSGITAARPTTHDGVVGLTDQLIQISCIAETLAKRENLTAAVVACLNGFRGSAGSITIQYSEIENETDIPPDPDYGYQTAIDFRVIY